MSIFGEYSGPVGERGYYSAADWNKLQNPEWAKDQAEYDRFAAQAAARAENRAEAMSRAREAIPFSYTQFGRGGTEPVFSLAGFSGHTSGGTAGLAGFSGTGSPTGTSTSTGATSSQNTNPGDQNPGDRVEPGVIPRAEGGVVPSVQYMQEGGMIASPYANPMKGSYSAMPMPKMGDMRALPMPVEQIKMNAPEPIPVLSGPMPAPDMSTGIVGPRIPANLQAIKTQITDGMPGIGTLFEAQFEGQQGAPLSGYQKFLMDTYGTRAIDNVQQHVGDDINQVVDLVRQAEQAHFGSRPEMQTGPNFGGAMAQPALMEALPAPRGGPMPGSGIMGGGIASLMGG